MAEQRDVPLFDSAWSVLNEQIRSPWKRGQQMTPNRGIDPLFDSWRVDTPVDQIVGEAIGAASMCWEHPERAGVFDNERASRIVDELLAALRAKLWTDG